MSTKTTTYEEFKVEGDSLLAKVRELLHEGNVRRIIVKHEDGSSIVEVPVTAGLAGIVLTVAVAPVLVAVGAIAAVVSNVTLAVEREDDEPSQNGQLPT